MYKRATLFTLLGLGLFTLFVCIQIGVVRQRDITRYKKFAAKTKELATSRSASATNQRREGVRKDIWFTQEDRSRLHYRIDSEASTLTLLPIDDKLDIIENLEHIKCWMQDKLYLAGESPMQQMRFFEADQGTYQYTTQQFLAQTVTLSLFRIPGHALPLRFDPSAAFLRGIAQDVSFSVSGKTTQFQAERFKATLKPQSEDVR
jgi:hypothetical protein